MQRYLENTQCYLTTASKIGEEFRPVVSARSPVDIQLAGKYQTAFATSRSEKLGSIDILDLGGQQCV